MYTRYTLYMIADVLTLRKASARFSGYASRFLHTRSKSYLCRDQTAGFLFGCFFWFFTLLLLLLGARSKESAHDFFPIFIHFSFCLFLVLEGKMDGPNYFLC